QSYAENLLGYRPDYVFTHVTRLVLSKAMWRDIRVAEHLDWLLAEQGKTAVLYMLTTTLPAGRRSEDVMRWEEEYGWPVHHRTGNGDLVDLEVSLYNSIAGFNWGSRALKIVLVNQFGWSQDRCGSRMPADMEFMDIRRGSDLEFGQSIYEPFGIAQVEPLSFGALCVVSNVCGCIGFAQRALEKTREEVELADFSNIVVANYTSLPPGWQVFSPWDALNIGTAQRSQIESYNSAYVARQIMERLPRDAADMQALLTAGQEVGKRMSWEVVVSDYLLPGLANATRR
ncbi:MAG TPA: glycosyltransferase, partial [Anaerolineae bacterium]|nr:glycosyltransferase [Anaerolineae bacterium]